MSSTKVEKKDFTWLIVIILIAVPLIVEFGWGENLYNSSHESIISAQEFMSDNFGLKLYDEEIKNSPNKDKDENENSYIYNEETNNNKILKSNENNDGTTKSIVISEIIHLINSNAFYLILCGILYNFVNIYKVFILSMTVFSANYISSTLSYIFQSPKPYMAFYKIKSVVIFNEWGSPNNQIVVLVSFSLSLYKVLIFNKYMDKKLWAKIVIIILLIVYCFLDIFLLYASGNCTFNHIFISLFMGLVIFIVIFYIFKVDLNKPKQLYDFIKFNILYYLVINAILFVFPILLIIFMKNEGDQDYYRNNGKEQVDRMPSNDFTKKYCGYRNKFYLNYGSFCNVICFLMNIIAFLSVKADFHFMYQDNYNNWNEGNFEKPKIEIVNMDQSSQTDEYSHIEESQWNHLGACINIIRFIILVVIIFVVFVIFTLVNSWSQREGYSLIFLIIIPMAIHVFGTFYLYKLILTKLKLTRAPKIKQKKLLDY